MPPMKTTTPTATAAVAILAADSPSAADPASTEAEAVNLHPQKFFKNVFKKKFEKKVLKKTFFFFYIF